MKKVSFTRLKVGLYIIYNCVLQNEKIQFTALSNLSQLLMLLLSKALNLWGGNFEKVIHISSKRKNWAKRLFHQSNSFYQQNKRSLLQLLCSSFSLVSRVFRCHWLFLCALNLQLLKHHCQLPIGLLWITKAYFLGILGKIYLIHSAR